MEKPKPIFKLEREVTFNCDSYCWTDGPKQLTCKIEIETTQLDNEGFVFDNRQIEEYIQENFAGKTIKVSCERIAETILYHLCDAIPTCRGVKVSVTGNPQATWLSASITREEMAQGATA